MSNNTRGKRMKCQIEFWDEVLWSVEVLDARGLITKAEKYKIQKRMRKQLDEEGIKAVHVGFREWKCEEK